MNTSKPYYQLIPEKVFQDFSTIIDLLRPQIKGFNTDYLKELISILSIHIRKDQEATPLKMKYIKILVPQGDKYLKGLIDLGIIERSGFAKVGESCYKYNFSPEYFSKYLSFPLHNAKLILRIEKANEEIRKDPVNSVRGHSEQIKYLKLLTINDGYKDYLDSNYIANTKQYNDIQAAATRIMIKPEPVGKVDETSGRFHSIVTNMAKGLRPFLRIKGEPLVNIDIKNSQPYLSTIILTDPSKVSWLTKNHDFALLLQSLKVSLNQDVKLYINLVVSGQIYEYLMQEFSQEGLTLTRDETKRQVLRILFARNRLPKDEINRKCRLIFKDRFPMVHRIFSKVRGRERGDKFKNFKRFAILLQSIESYLMLDLILKRIYKELPGTIAITIHDSIMTGILTNNVEAVKNIMTEELQNFVGIKPTLKIENFDLLNFKQSIYMNKEEKEGREGENINSNQYHATTFVSNNNSMN